MSVTGDRMLPFEFFDVEACHFESPSGSVTLWGVTVEPATRDKPANFEWLKQAVDFEGRFNERNRLNIPGPFFGAETDTCETGIAAAPDNVMLDSEGQEFVFKQPENLAELKAVIHAAAVECFCGYGADGNDHWNLTLIREWWRGRQAITEWINERSRQIQTPRESAMSVERQKDLLDPLLAFKKYLEERAEAYLKAYAFYLLERRVPTWGDVLPEVRG